MASRADGPLRTAIVGFGGIARGLHLPLLTSLPEYTVPTVVARSAGAASAAAEALPDAEVLRSVDELLAAPARIDLAVVTAQDDAHVGLGLALIGAGIPTVIEKPLAPTVEGVERLQAAARSAGVPVVAFQNKRWDRDYATVAAAVRRGDVGEVLRYEAWLVRWSARIWDNWRERARPGTVDGPLADIGSHLVDQAVALLGPVAAVSAELDRRRPGTEVVDDGFLALRHVSGARTHLHLGALTSWPTPGFVVQGTEAALVSTGSDGQFAAIFHGVGPEDPRWGSFDSFQVVRHAGGPPGPVPLPGETTPVEPAETDAREFYRLLAAALRTGAPLPVDPAETLHVLRVLEAAARSAAEGGAPIALGPDGHGSGAIGLSRENRVDSIAR
ncbi:Gfo/Idh/MocA family oxidoreductase [Amnibacterium sp. CER49]|uniref:Gfo/Idh/MocA family protein n=1 Tax=Amnibacterium sp. CER49 TaxID=3039161 RepID=UPI00244C19D0|nr:Gfo/Idh/MocA family oxidoreductase [Amnibacterium sp. CER49]MDH2444869.1 Gfo/Idh/MocA family oxidoreductase [Amnibacterium sp. CER49]